MVRQVTQDGCLMNAVVTDGKKFYYAGYKKIPDEKRRMKIIRKINPSSYATKSALNEITKFINSCS